MPNHDERAEVILPDVPYPPRAPLLVHKHQREQWPVYYKTIVYGAPGVATITPAFVLIGSPVFDLHVIGAQFTPASKIVINGTLIDATVYVGPDELVATVDPTTVTVPTVYTVAVDNGGGSVSNARPLTFTDEFPTVISISPNPCSVGFDVTAVDGKFKPGDKAVGAVAGDLAFLITSDTTMNVTVPEGGTSQEVWVQRDTRQTNHIYVTVVPAG